MVFILICLLISPPDGLDSAQVLSNFQLQFLRLMALPGIEELIYLDPEPRSAHAPIVAAPEERRRAEGEGEGGPRGQDRQRLLLRALRRLLHRL